MTSAASDRVPVVELVQHTHANGVVTYRSALLARAGFRHGFSTRTGGVSVAPFDTMNLGVAQAPGEPDSDANIAQNAERLLCAIEASDESGASGTLGTRGAVGSLGAGDRAGAVGTPGAHGTLGSAIDACAQMVRVRQVHGCGVHVAASGERFAAPTVAADAIVTTHRGIAACIRTADCVPVLVGCTTTGAAVAVHAGWRGIVAGVVAAGVRALEACGGGAGGFVAAVGPSIGCEAYEVGEEVAGAFDAAGLARFVVRMPAWPKPHLACADAVRAQLAACGVPPACIEGGGLCTATHGREFFSYRRDGARSGRMGAVILPRA